MGEAGDAVRVIERVKKTIYLDTHERLLLVIVAHYDEGSGFTASVSELAELMGCSTNKAFSAISNLQAFGLVERVESPPKTRKATYKVVS